MLGCRGPSTPQPASQARRAAPLRMTSHIFKIAVQIALAFLRRCGVQMADGDGERIGGVGGFGDLIEIQKTRHHLLDLMFFGAAVSDHRGLDGEWRVFGDFESGGSGGQHGDSAHLAELQGGLHVGGVENVFDGNAVGPVLGDEFLKADGDARQAHGHGVARGNFDGAADDADKAIIIAVVGEQFDYAVSGVFRTAVDAEDAHEGSVAGQWSVVSGQRSAVSDAELRSAGQPRAAVPTHVR